MYRFAICLLTCVVFGCGSSSQPQQPPATEQAAEAETKQNNRATSQTAVKPPKPSWPPKFNIADDAFGDIPTAVQALLHAAETDDQRTRAQATAWLAKQGPAVVDQLAVHLQKGRGTEVEVAICYVLGCIEDVSVPPLVETITNSDDPIVRQYAAKYLALAPTTRPDRMQYKVKALVDVMQNHPDAATRVAAVKALAQVGPPAQPLAQAPLQKILNDPSQSNDLRQEAGNAMDRVAQRKTLLDQ